MTGDRDRISRDRDWVQRSWTKKVVSLDHIGLKTLTSVN